MKINFFSFKLNINSFFYNLTAFDKFNIFYGLDLEQELDDMQISYHDSPIGLDGYELELHNAIKAIALTNKKLFSFGAKITSEYNLEQMGDKRTLDEDLKYISVQKWINKQLTDGNSQGLIDNLVDYNKFQYSKIEEVINSEFMFVVNLNIVNTEKLVNKSIGRHRLHYKNKQLTLSGNKSIFKFDIEKMQFPVNTMRNSFSFDYDDVTYNLTDIRHQFVLYEMCRYINGSYKRK